MRPVLLKRNPHVETISILASLRDATAQVPYHVDYPEISILASLRDATRAHHIGGVQLRDFNPRIPAGCDILTAQNIADYLDFNPRIPAGCDIDSVPVKKDEYISILASLRDAT